MEKVPIFCMMDEGSVPFSINYRGKQYSRHINGLQGAVSSKMAQLLLAKSAYVHFFSLTSLLNHYFLAIKCSVPF
jgi:hypothetical protein